MIDSFVIVVNIEVFVKEIRLKTNSLLYSCIGPRFYTPGSLYDECNMRVYKYLMVLRPTASANSNRIKTIRGESKWLG